MGTVPNPSIDRSAFEGKLVANTAQKFRYPRRNRVEFPGNLTKQRCARETPCRRRTNRALFHPWTQVRRSGSIRRHDCWVL